MLLLLQKEPLLLRWRTYLVSKKLLFRIETENLISTLLTPNSKNPAEEQSLRGLIQTDKIISREEGEKFEERIVRVEKRNETRSALLSFLPEKWWKWKKSVISREREREENRDKPAARNSRSCNTLEVVGWYACDYLLSHRRINDESPMGKPVAGAAERHAVLTTSLGPQHGHSNGTSSPRDAN